MPPTKTRNKKYMSLPPSTKTRYKNTGLLWHLSKSKYKKYMSLPPSTTSRYKNMSLPPSTKTRYKNCRSLTASKKLRYKKYISLTLSTKTKKFRYLAPFHKKIKSTLSPPFKKNGKIGFWFIFNTAFVEIIILEYLAIILKKILNYYTFPYSWCF